MAARLGGIYRRSLPVLRGLQRREASSAAAVAAEADEAVGKVKTGVLMMNMGGPARPEDTQDFLHRLFTDGDIIELGGGWFQNLLGPFIAKRRAPKVAAQYEQIGGSPIGKWTKLQGERMCKLLDETRPESAPHKAYTAFRYVEPLSKTALEEMAADGVEHAVAFSQYPQWSCTTTGSSMNELWRELRELGMHDKFKWSIIDRWSLHQGFIDAVADRIQESLEEKFPEEERSKVTILFSSHSVPMKVVERGDHYVPEVAATVKAVMETWDRRVQSAAVAGVRETNKHVLAWQSKVGFLPWMTPSTSDAIKHMGETRGMKHVLVVPVAFTSDHIETLYEIGIEYKEEAEEVGITNFHYTDGLNDLPAFVQAQADIVAEHLDAGRNYSAQYKMKCLSCTKPQCRKIVNPMY